MDTCHRDSEERDAQCHPSSGVSCLLECGRDEDHVCPQKRSAKTLARVHPGHRPQAAAPGPPPSGHRARACSCPRPAWSRRSHCLGSSPLAPCVRRRPSPPWSLTRLRGGRGLERDALTETYRATLRKGEFASQTWCVNVFCRRRWSSCHPALFN